MRDFANSNPELPFRPSHAEVLRLQHAADQILRTRVVIDDKDQWSAVADNVGVDPSFAASSMYRGTLIVKVVPVPYSLTSKKPPIIWIRLVVMVRPKPVP